MKRHRLVALLAGAALGLSTGASAQEQAVSFQKGTALSIFGGGASATGGTEGALGAAIGWELTPRFTVEGSGIWHVGTDAGVFSAVMGPRINLRPRRSLVPYMSGGIGVHRSEERDGSFTRTVSDAAIVLGGGLDVYLRPHLALRPDVRVLLVPADGDTRTIAVYGVHLAYHFEEHRVTP